MSDQPRPTPRTDSIDERWTYCPFEPSDSEISEWAQLASHCYENMLEKARELERESDAREGELSDYESRLSASQSEIVVLQCEVSAREERIRELEDRNEYLKALVSEKEKEAEDWSIKARKERAENAKLREALEACKGWVEAYGQPETKELVRQALAGN